jgi:hypothetical protein
VRELLERMRERIGDEIAETWSIGIDATAMPAVAAAIRRGRKVTVGDLMRAPDNREIPLSAVPLLLQRHEGKSLLPGNEEVLAMGDRLLLCGRGRRAGTAALDRQRRSGVALPAARQGGQLTGALYAVVRRKPCSTHTSASSTRLAQPWCITAGTIGTCSISV